MIIPSSWPRPRLLSFILRLWSLLPNGRRRRRLRGIPSTSGGDASEGGLRMATLNPAKSSSLWGRRRGGGGGGGGGEGFFVGSFSPGRSPSTSWHRSLRRKRDASAADAHILSCVDPDGDDFETGTSVARVETRNEEETLREALLSHHQTIQKLQEELEEERSAAASAAQEAMSMIVRLQHEKSEIVMESRQFQRVTEENLKHNQEEISSLEDLLFKREQAMQALSCEVQAYRHRLLSYGFSLDEDAPPSEPQTPDTATSSFAIPQIEFPQESEYPSIKCISDTGAELDKYPSCETPREHLQKLEQRIYQLERTPSSIFGNVMDKGVIVGHSPRARPWHLRNLSCGSYGSVLEFNKGDEFPTSFDAVSDYEEMNDRVYTVDTVHGVSDDYVSTPRELHTRRSRMGNVTEKAEITKLNMRLQELEADRESMRQTLVSMGADKAQMMILREIAQQMCKEGTIDSRIIKKSSFSQRFSCMPIIKDVISFVVFCKKPSQIMYTVGIAAGAVGFLLFLNKPCRTRQRRLL
ncbi:myosin-binding protein 7-like [Curcuma longa]|uniref:myosin-binding protein 7-like n=1 Tax=Curcuma longa TaxID=136217 RepID=UPI003D9FB0A1